MPERSGPAERTLAPAGAEVEGECTVAQLCAQPTPVLANSDDTFQLIPLFHRAHPSPDALNAPRGVLASAFHPPRV